MMSVFVIETKRIWDIHRHSILHLLSRLKYPFKWEMGAAFHPQIVHISRDVWPSVTWRTDKQEWLTSRSFEWTWTVGPLVDFHLALPSHKIPLPNLPYQFLKYISVEDFWQLVFFLSFFFWGGGNMWVALLVVVEFSPQFSKHAHGNNVKQPYPSLAPYLKSITN